MSIKSDNPLSTLLNKILRRMALSFDEIPSSRDQWQTFLKSIANLIDDCEQERYLLERSMEMSSREMRELFDKFETAQSIASIGSWYYYKTEKRTLWSKKTYDIFGFESTTPVPEANELMQYVYENDRKNLFNLIERAFKDETDFETEFRIYHKPDNLIKWVYVKGHPEIVIESGSNKVVISGVIMDITVRKQTEEDMKRLNQQLIDLSRLSGMSEIATSTLHNIGNVLNSVNVSVSVIEDIIKNSNVKKLIKLNRHIQDNAEKIPDFLVSDPKGNLILSYLDGLSNSLYVDHIQINDEIKNLQKNIQHIKDITVMQKDISGISGITEVININEIIDTAINIGCGLTKDMNFRIVKNENYNSTIRINKSKLLQILVNMFRNAKEALQAKRDSIDKKIIIGVKKNSADEYIEIMVKDNGIGILKENLQKIFSMGFTTKISGHGFGLHSSALAAKELGGSLTAQSEGKEKGAIFLLKIPESVEVTYEKQK